MSPIVPYLCEYIWQNMVRCLEPNEKESVFLAKFPEADIITGGEQLVRETELVRDTIAMAQRLRNENQIKIKRKKKRTSKRN